MAGQSVRGIDQRLLDAAKCGNVVRILDLVEEDGNIIFGATPDGNTMFHLAVRFRWSKQVVQLCPLDILTQSNAMGQTVLHLAVLSRNMTAIKTIRSKIVDVEDGRREALMQMVRSVDVNGDTVLHLALRNVFEDVANKLMELDGTGLSNLVNKRGESPLYLAALGGLSAIVERLLEFAPTNYRGPPPNNPTVLHCALLTCNKGSVRELLKKMPFLDKETDGRGFIPLHYSVQSAPLYMTRLLLEHDPSTGYLRDSHGNVAIHIAAFHGSVEAFKELYARCPDSIDAVNGSCENVLHCAVKNIKKNMTVKILVMEELVRTLINQQNNMGDTPLHLAIRTGIFHFNDVDSVCRVLNPRIVNNDGHTAYDIFCSRPSQMGAYDTIYFSELFARLKTKYDSLIHVNNPLSDKGMGLERLEKKAGNVVLVAILMATITFTAAFTVPGGYIQDLSDGKDLLGTAVSAKKVAFKVFIISDTVSLCCSLVVVYLFTAPAFNYNPARFYKSHRYYSSVLMDLSFWGMLIAFASAVMVVLPPRSKKLSYFVTSMCLITPVVIFVAGKSMELVNLWASIYNRLRRMFSNLIGQVKLPKKISMVLKPSGSGS